MRVALIVAAVLLVIAPNSEGCSCVTWPAKTEFKRVAAVFLGEVIAVSGENVTFRVIESFKGAPRETLEVNGGRVGDCGLEGTAVGARHVIWATSPGGGRLEANMCSRSWRGEIAAKDLRLLRRRAWWWRTPLSSIRIVRWLERLL